MKFLVLLLLPLLFNCSGKAPQQTISVGFDATTMGLSTLGGLSISGINTQTGDRFTRLLGSDTKVQEQLSNGTWTLYAIGWSGTYGPFTGEVNCAIQNNITVNGTDGTIDLTLDNASCFDSRLTQEVGTGSPKAYATSTFKFCDGDLQNLAFDCAYDPTTHKRERGIIGSYRVVVNGERVLNKALKFTGESISSGCFDTTNTRIDDASKTSEQLNLPNFIAPLNFPLQIISYTDNQCGALNNVKIVANTLNPKEAKLVTLSGTVKKIYANVPLSAICSESDAKNITNAFASGDGSANYPYVICSRPQLRYFQTKMHDSTVGATLKSASFILARDLDLAPWVNYGTITPNSYESCLKEGGTFTPVGKYYDGSCNPLLSSHIFNGIFDGNNRTIKNFRFSSDKSDPYNGFFAKTGLAATIRDLTFERAHMEGGPGTGVVVGSSSGNIINVTVRKAKIKGANNLGGIVGEASSAGMILSNLVVTDANIEGEDFVGGIVGTTSSNLTSVGFQGEIRGNLKVGGIAGMGSNITDAWSEGVLQAQNDFIGGIAGYVSNVTVARSSLLIYQHDQAATFRVGGIAGQGTGINTMFLGKIQSNCTTGCSIGAISGTNSSASRSVTTSPTGMNGSDGVVVTFAQARSPSFLSTVDTNYCTPENSGFTCNGEGSLPVTANEQTPCSFASNNSTSFISFQAGRGTFTNPYLICNEAQFSSIGTFGASTYFKMVRDLNLSGISFINNFSAKLDGAGHYLFGYDNVSANTNTAPFFTISTSGEVRNLTIAGYRVQSTASAVAIAPLAIANYGLIDHVRVMGSTINQTSPSSPQLAGIAIMNIGKISNVSADVSLSASERIGGIVSSNTGVIEYAHSRVNILSGNASSSIGRVGGIAAYNSGTIRRSAFDGNIRTGNSTTRNVGGIVGYMDTGLTSLLEDVLVSKRATINIGSSTIQVGGIIGESSTGTRKMTRAIFDGSFFIPLSNSDTTLKPLVGSGTTMNTYPHFFSSPYKEFTSNIAGTTATYNSAADACEITLGATVDDPSVALGALVFNSNGFGAKGLYNYLGTSLYMLQTDPGQVDPSFCSNISSSYSAASTITLLKANVMPETLNIMSLKNESYDLADASDASDAQKILNARISLETGGISVINSPVWTYEDAEDGLRLIQLDD